MFGNKKTKEPTADKNQCGRWSVHRVDGKKYLILDWSNSVLEWTCRGEDMAIHHFSGYELTPCSDEAVK